jgi:hypothetical protein
MYSAPLLIQHLPGKQGLSSRFKEFGNCMISSLSGEAFKVKSDDDNSPQCLLLRALKSGKLRAILKDYDVGRTWWSGLSKLDPDASLRTDC